MSSVAGKGFVRPGREFLSGGGEMGALTRAYDWASSPLGPPETWPLSLRVAVRLLLTSRHPMFIWWGPDLIQFYNDAYRETMGPERHPSALGQRGRECWDEIWDIIGPQIAFVMEGKGATWHEDQLVPVTRFGSRQDVWWTYGYSPIDDGTGGVGGVLVVCNDVTEQHLAMDRLRVLFQQAPGFMAVLAGPEHKFELVNDAYSTLVANRAVIGKPVRDALPEVAEHGFVRRLDEVFATGEPLVEHGRPVMLLSESGELEQRYLDYLYQPICDKDGAVTGIFVAGYDVTEQKRSEAHRQLLIRELSHRVKNTLAIVQAIASRTLRADVAPEQARTDFNDRILALARAHDILTTERWHGAAVQSLVEKALEHQTDSADRFRFGGPPVLLSARAVTTMTMALHELSTNAAKYGALSTAEGRIEVTWELVGPEGDQRLKFTWAEKNGPPVEPPKRKGFGSRLIEQSIAMEFEGSSHVDFRPDGLVCTIEAPLAQMQNEAAA
jgi:two-component sensor histidine kinase/PAS domain-containing protein